jgi:hypothetical protein
MLVIFLPLLALLMKITRWLFNSRARNPYFAGITATVWVVALISLIALIAMDADKGAFRESVETRRTISLTPEKTLYIQLSSKKHGIDDYEYYQFFNRKFVWDDNRNYLLANPSLRLKRSLSDSMYVIVTKQYLSAVNAGSYYDMEEIEYSWNKKDSILCLDEYFSCDEDDVWRLPRVRVTLEIPENRKIQFTRYVSEIIVPSDSITHNQYEEMSDKTLFMTRNGLSEAR